MPPRRRKKKGKFRRRTLLKAAVAGSAVGALGLGTYSLTRPHGGAAFQDELIRGAADEDRILGRTGLKVPPLSMGAGHCEHPKLIRKAVTGKMPLVETAREYLVLSRLIHPRSSHVTFPVEVAR